MMHMSKGIDASQTPISEYSYQLENDNNTKQALLLLEQMFPVIAEFERARENFGMSHEDLLDFMYNIQLVKNHGYGTVKVIVAGHKVTLVEALIKTLKFRELEEKVKEE